VRGDEEATTRSGSNLIPEHPINDPKHWRRRAKEARALAEQIADPEAKRTMLKTPMTTSGSRNERKNEQQGACHSQSSCSIREIAQIDRTGKRGTPCSASCVKSMVEGPTLRRLRTGLSGTPHTRKPFDPRMCLKTGKTL
jgi:hypothetical protein